MVPHPLQRSSPSAAVKGDTTPVSTGVEATGGGRVNHQAAAPPPIMATATPASSSVGIPPPPPVSPSPVGGWTAGVRSTVASTAGEGCPKHRHPNEEDGQG